MKSVWSGECKETASLVCHGSQCSSHPPVAVRRCGAAPGHAVSPQVALSRHLAVRRAAALAVTILYNSDIISTMSHSARCCRWRWWSPAGRARCAVQARGRGRGRSGGQPSRWGRTWGHLRSPEVTWGHLQLPTPWLRWGRPARGAAARAAVWPPADRGRCQVPGARWPGGQVVRWWDGLLVAWLLINLFVFPGGEEGARPGGINIYIITVTLSYVLGSVYQMSC